MSLAFSLRRVKGRQPPLSPARSASSWLHRLDRLNEAAADGDVHKAQLEFDNIIPRIPLEKSTIVYNTLLKASLAIT